MSSEARFSIQAVHSEARGPSALRRYARTCRPPWYARGGHAQTLLGHLLPCRAPSVARDPRARRVEVELTDGERLVVHALDGTSGLRVHLFHGLCGDADSESMRSAAAALGARGHSVWCVNHRGCGAGRGLAGRPYHSGSADDLAAVLAASRREAPGERQLAIGFSLSGNALLLLAARGGAAGLTGLVAVNPPIDIARASHDVGRGFSRLYELSFLSQLRRAIAERERDGLLRRSYSIPRTATLCRFDDLYTAPEGGFADGADYYRRSSTRGLLARISTPAVILTAADDPFVDVQVYEGEELPACLYLHIEPRGGHMAYLESRGLGLGRWLPGALVHYVEALAERAATDANAPQQARGVRSENASGEVSPNPFLATIKDRIAQRP